MMKYFDQLEAKLYDKMGKSTDEVKMLKRQERVKKLHRASILSRKGSLIER